MSDSFVKLVESINEMETDQDVSPKLEDDQKDFSLTFDDAEAYRIMSKEIRKGSSVNLSDDHLKTENKLQAIEDMGKMGEFNDASFKSYMASREKWRNSPDYETTSLYDHSSGGVIVKDGIMTLDVNLK